ISAEGPMAAFSKMLSFAFSWAMILAIAGCTRDGSPKASDSAPKATVTTTSKDLRKLSASEVAARIKENGGVEFANVVLASDGTNQYLGTATTAEGKKLRLTATVTE